MRTDQIFHFIQYRAVLLLCALFTIALSISSRRTHAHGPYFEITRNSEGEVSHLTFLGDARYFRDFRIDGKRLHDTKSLRSLFINHHEVSDEEINYLVGLESVTTLKIGDLLEEIVLSDEQLSRVGQMQWLEGLSVSKRQAHQDGWAFLSNLKNLKSFYATDRFNDQATSYLLGLTEIQELNLTGSLSHLASDRISRLHNLRKLAIHSYEIDDLFVETISHLPSLVSLEISEGRTTSGIFKSIAEMKEIETFIASTPATGEDIAPLAKLGSMTSLHLDQCDTIPFSLRAKMPALHTLGLGGRHDFESLSNVFGHEKLERLYLGQTICDNRIIDVLSSMPNLSHATFKGWADEDAIEYAKLRLGEIRYHGGENYLFIRVKTDQTK